MGRARVGSDVVSLHVVVAVAAYVGIALGAGLAVRWLAGRHEASAAGDPETAFRLRRDQRRGLAVGWAATTAVTRLTAFPAAAADALASGGDALGVGVGSVAGPVGTLAAYLLPAVPVAVAARLATVPSRRTVRRLELRYRDAAAWELERDGVGAVVVLGAAVVIALAPSGWSRVLTTLALGLLVTALAPVALVVALRTRWPTDTERARVADLLPSGVALRVVDDRTRIGSAFAAGVVPGLERVFVTESLFDVLEDDELRAVVAHEVGHHERHHVLLRFSLVALAAGAAVGVASSAPDLALAGIVVGAVPFALVLAWVVRRTEHAADAYAARVVGGPALADALETLVEHRFVLDSGEQLRAFAYHPPLGERIEGLRRAGGAGVTGDASTA